MQLNKISEVHLQDDGGYQVVARLESGSVTAEFRVDLSSYRWKARVARKKTIEELTAEAKDRILKFCKGLVESN